MKYPSGQAFLVDFKHRGGYLIDLCRKPVNGMTAAERMRERELAKARLARELIALHPTRVVTVMKAIAPTAAAAAAEAGISRQIVSLPFPTWHRRAYIAGLVAVLREPRDRRRRTG